MLTKNKLRVAYFTGGPANLISAHQSWKSGVHEPTEVSKTFSSQIQQACADLDCLTLMISVKGPTEKLQDGLFFIEHRPKKAVSGMKFHLEEFIYAVDLLKTTLKFKADIAFIDSGTTYFFIASLFSLFGIKVVPILHNTLWPTGFYPTKRIHRWILQLDKYLFWRKTPTALISVSPECERQVRHLVPHFPYPTYQVRAQFLAEYFSKIAPINFPENKAFQVMFIGRVELMKGVFDILKMAEYVNKQIPNRVKWKICGGGLDLEALRQQHEAMDLHDSVELVGWVGLEGLKEIYNTSHCCIVPTRSIFKEALAMTAVEAILAGRPLISNPVVPATELLAPACLLGKTDDYLSHAQQVVELASNKALYEKLKSACTSLGKEFLDPNKSLEQAVKIILEGEVKKQ